MTRKELIQLGFKRKGGTAADGFWYELKFKSHIFITNDNHYYKKGTDKWFLGYVNKLSTDNRHDYFWFNNRLNLVGEFTAVFFILTGKSFELPKRRIYTPKSK